MNEFDNYQNDLPMVYELLLRRVYHCGRGDDPFGLANTDRYYLSDKKRLGPDTYIGIWTALYLLKSQIENYEDKERLSNIKIEFENDPTATYFKKISKELFEILDKYQISEFPHSESLLYKNY